MATSFYSDEELQQMGFAHVGHDVMISRKASIYGASNIWIGNHVRVDDFCVLSGKITFGNYIHVAVTTTGNASVPPGDPLSGTKALNQQKSQA